MFSGPDAEILEEGDPQKVQTLLQEYDFFKLFEQVF